MPENQSFYYPFRLLTVSEKPRGTYQPDLSVLSGYVGTLECRLDVHTPLEVNYASQTNTPFNRKPLIPGSSLKGMLRSMAELIGRGCVAASSRNRGGWANCSGETCCITCDMFGRLSGGIVNRGKVAIDDATPVTFAPHKKLEVLQGQPKETHRAFYPSDHEGCIRKLYHHQPWCAKNLTIKDQGGGNQKPSELFPVAAGSQFTFSVRFEGLDATQVGLLAYALQMEPGLLHKLGRGKSRGLGSVKIHITGIAIQSAMDHIRRVTPQDTWPDEIQQHIQNLENDRTLDDARKMLSWDAARNLTPMRFPGYQWFRTNSQVALRSVDRVIPRLPETMQDPALPELKAEDGGSAALPAGFMSPAQWHAMDPTHQAWLNEILAIRDYKKQGNRWVQMFETTDDPTLKQAMVGAFRYRVAEEDRPEFETWVKAHFGAEWALVPEKAKPKPAPPPKVAAPSKPAMTLSQALEKVESAENGKDLKKMKLHKGAIWDGFNDQEKLELAQAIHAFLKDHKQELLLNNFPEVKALVEKS